MKIARKSSNSALTFIEVLIIVVVMAILAAMLLVPRHRVTAAAQGIACMNNLKQVQIGFRIWTQDNNDKFPMQVSSSSGGAMEPAAAVPGI